MTSIRTRWAVVILGLGLVAVLFTGFPAQAQSDDGDDTETEVSTEPTMSVTLDITDQLPRSSFTLRGRVVSVIHGRDRGGQTATAEEVDPRDSAEAQHAERLARELDANEPPVLAPAARSYGAVGFKAVPGERDDLAEGQLGDRCRVGARHVGHPDPVFAGGMAVDARRIHAHAGAGHNL
jgi:hypothetical protein